MAIESLLCREVFDNMSLEDVLNHGGPTLVDVTMACALIEALPPSGIRGSWAPEAIVRTLEAISADYDGKVWLKTRRADRSRAVVRKGSGWLSGPEIRDRTRWSNLPFLHLQRISGGRDNGWDGANFWVSALVWPEDMDSIMLAGAA